MKILLYISALCTFVLAACTTTPQLPNYRYIEEKPLPDYENPTLNISMATWTKESLDYNHKLRIYIDGDALDDNNRKPVIPYPITEIAQNDPYPFSLVLGRPCYYTSDDICSKKEIWQDGRFLPEIIAQMSIVVERWIKRYHPSEIEFVGYDGGAAMALLLAARVKNTPASVVTFGGIFDTDRQAALKGKDLHPGSLNPANEPYKLVDIPQIHYVGGQDTVATKRLAEEFIAGIESPKSIQLRVVPQATHTNWKNYILKLINQPAKKPQTPDQTQTQPATEVE